MSEIYANMSGILAAAETGNFLEVKRLVESGVEVNEKDDDGNTVLHYAASSGSLEIVKYLVEQGADVNCKTERNETALFYVAEQNSLEIVKYLVQRGTDINCKNVENETALHYAAYHDSLEIVKYLVEHGAEINFQNNYNDSPLHYAAELNSLEMMKYLVEHGADINSKSKNNATALSVAIRTGSLEIVKYLVEHGAEVNFENNDNDSPLHYAAELNSLEMIKYLVEHGADINCKSKSNATALSVAARTGSLEIVKYLVERGANVNCESSDNDSPLHYAAKEGSLSMVIYLVEHHANVNFKNEWNKTALHYAVESDSLEIVKYLVKHGADVNCRSKGKAKATALHFAVGTGSLEIVEYLFTNGANVTTKEHRGEDTVLYWACRKGDEFIVDYLLQHGANEDIDEKDRWGRSCLGKACYDGNIAVVRTFLKFKVDIRKEVELQCGNEEIANILNLELNPPSIKHREKIENLKGLDGEKSTKVGSPLKYFSPDKYFSLGNGSMGTSVYVGIMEDGSEVAVKRMLIQACEDIAENEKKILGLTNTEKSPFIVSYRDFLKDHTFVYLIVDLCEETLKEHVESNSITDLKEYGPRMIKQILSGLKFLHRLDILHRDLKPSNVLVDIEGRMRLADFGLSRVLNEDETTVHTDPKGTREWMPAEVIKALDTGRKGRFKRKSDIHVAGMIAFFILTKGEHPFGNYIHDRMANILKANPVNFFKLEDLEAKQFITSLIRPDIDERPSAAVAMSLPFLDHIEIDEELHKPKISVVGNVSE